MSDVVVRPIPLDQTRQLRRDVLRPHETLEQVAEHEPDNAFAIGAFDDGQQIAVGFIAPDDEAGTWRLRGMAAAPHARGRGTGTLVLDALLRHAAEHGARRIWCNARLPARSLYERAGMRVASDEFEIPSIGPHYVMELVLEATA